MIGKGIFLGRPLYTLEILRLLLFDPKTNFDNCIPNQGAELTPFA